MTLFEYLATGVSLILSFAVLRALSGVPHAVRAGRRYWVHATWLATTLASCLFHFWGFWSYSEAEWTLIRFSAVLSVPSLLYVYISLLVPPDPAAVTSWRDYFFEVRDPLFAVGLILHVDSIVTNHLLLGSSWRTSLPLFVVVAIYAIGIASAKPNVHAVLAIGFLCMIAIAFLVLNEPSPFTRVAP